MEWIGGILANLTPQGSFQFVILCIFLYLVVTKVLEYLEGKKTVNTDAISVMTNALEKSILSKCQDDYAPISIVQDVCDLKKSHEKMKELNSEARVREEGYRMHLQAITKELSEIKALIDNTLKAHDNVLKEQTEVFKSLRDRMEK